MRRGRNGRLEGSSGLRAAVRCEEQGRDDRGKLGDRAMSVSSCGDVGLPPYYVLCRCSRVSGMQQPSCGPTEHCCEHRALCTAPGARRGHARPAYIHCLGRPPCQAPRSGGRLHKGACLTARSRRERGDSWRFHPLRWTCVCICIAAGEHRRPCGSSDAASNIRIRHRAIVIVGLRGRLRRESIDGATGHLTPASAVQTCPPTRKHAQAMPPVDRHLCVTGQAGGAHRVAQ
jgi:hypothetical protein